MIHLMLTTQDGSRDPLFRESFSSRDPWSGYRFIACSKETVAHTGGAQVNAPWDHPDVCQTCVDLLKARKTLGFNYFVNGLLR